MLKMALLGLPVGLLLGYSLQRGGFCMNSAFRQIAFERDSRLFKAYGIALLIQMAVLLLLGGVLEIDPAAPPVWWLAATVGGFVFGMGMVLARGCTSGNFYRLGEGLIGAYVVVGVFVLSILVTEVGLLAPLKRALRAPQLDVPRTLDGWLGVHGVWILLPLAAGLAYWIWRAPPGQASDGRWHWMKTGFVVGLVAAIAWIASSMTGREYGLSMIQPTMAWGRWLMLGDGGFLNWSAFMLLGLPLGAALGARRGGHFQWKLPYPTRILQQMGGGAMMGVGGSIAGGCNIGHSLTGVAVLSVTSILATVAIVLGCWAGVYLFFYRLKVPR